MHLAYDIKQSYEFNYHRGPSFAEQRPPEVPITPLKQFLGLPVASRLGIAAGLLLNSKWVTAYARRGFDILTYKTVRSAFRPAYPQPNWVFVEFRGPETVRQISTPPASPNEISSSVCFGMPSMDPGVWRKDVEEARRSLGPAQVLIVSIVGTPDESNSETSLARDFQDCAAWAVEAGAHVIEANFSCPNVCTAEGEIYNDPAFSKRLALKIREAIGATPLLLKIGAIPTAEKALVFLEHVAGIVDGVTLVNCLVSEVLRSDGTPVFGDKFRRAGVLGRMIHEPSVQLVRTVAELISEHKLPLSVAAVGGASTTDDIEDFFAAGAQAVLFGSSPMYLPNLAIAAKQKNPLW